MARSSLTYIPGFFVKFFFQPIYRAGLSDTNLKGSHPGVIHARFGLIWFNGFRGEDLNGWTTTDATWMGLYKVIFLVPFGNPTWQKHEAQCVKRVFSFLAHLPKARNIC
jgi:hypothetical protein